MQGDSDSKVSSSILAIESSFSLAFDLLDQDSILLLKFLAFMPAGMTPIQIDKITGLAVEQQQLTKLFNLGLLTKDKLTDRYLLKDNFLRDLITRELTYETFEEVLESIIEYNIDMMGQLYNNLFREN